MIQKIKTQLIKYIFSKLNFQISDSLLISIILHIFLLIVMLVSPYIYTTSKIKKIKTSDPIIVDLENFKIGSKTIVTPIHVSQNKKEMSKKEQNKSEKKKYFKSEIKTTSTVNESKKEDIKQNSKTSITKNEKVDYIDNSKNIEKVKKVKEIKPIKKTDDNLLSSRIGGLDDLLASVDGLKRTKQNLKDKKTTEIKKGIATTEIDSNINKDYPITNTNLVQRQMAISYIDAVKIKLASCWNLDPGAKGVKNMQIKIRASFLPDGSINNINILNYEEYRSSPWFQAVADSAKRALIICSPYNLPSEFYKDWQNIVFTFYPDKKSII